MSELQKSIKMLRKKFNDLTVRERVLVTAVAIGAVILFWNFSVYSFFDNASKEYASKKMDLDNKVRNFEGQISAKTMIAGKEVSSVAEQTKALRTEVALLEKTISEQVKEMISPSEMRTVFKNIVDRAEGLELIGIETMPPKAITITSKSANPEKQTAPPSAGKVPEPAKLEIKTFNIYSHELKLEFISDYFDTLKFIKAIESQSLKMFWDELTYEVTEYPKAKVKIVVHTLSLEEGWIGG